MERQTHPQKNETIVQTTVQLIGWIFFVAGTGLFIVSSARSGDHLALAGSIAFLLGCLVFMAPLVEEALRCLPSYASIKATLHARRIPPLTPVGVRRRPFRRSAR